MSAWVAQHRKLLAAIAGAVITVVVQVWGTSTPWVTALILIGTAAGVYRAPNEPQPAPAGPALPSTAAGGGLPVTGTVKVVPEPQPVQERIAEPPPPGPGVPQ